MDASHPLAPAGPWDISARSAALLPSPGWVGSASPRPFAPVPGASFTASPRADAFRGWEKQRQLGHVHSISGSLRVTWAFKQRALPGDHNPVPWMHFSKQFLQGWVWHMVPGPDGWRVPGAAAQPIPWVLSCSGTPVGWREPLLHELDV